MEVDIGFNTDNESGSDGGDEDEGDLYKPKEAAVAVTQRNRGSKPAAKQPPAHAHSTSKSAISITNTRQVFTEESHTSVTASTPTRQAHPGSSSSKSSAKQSTAHANSTSKSSNSNTSSQEVYTEESNYPSHTSVTNSRSTPQAHSPIDWNSYSKPVAKQVKVQVRPGFSQSTDMDVDEIPADNEMETLRQQLLTLTETVQLLKDNIVIPQMVIISISKN
jgi:hypothetical protein